MKRTLLSVFLCLCLLCALAEPAFTYAHASMDGGTAESPEAVEEKYQPTIDNLNDKLDQLAEERKKIESNIASAKSEKDRAIAEKNAIDGLIVNTRGQIETLAERITAFQQNIVKKQGEIEEKQVDIEQKQVEIDENYQILRKRLRAMYMQDNTTTLGLIAGSDSFSDLLSRVEIVKRIADHDRQLLATLTEQRVVLEKDKAELENDKLELQNGKAAVESDQAATKEKQKELDVQQQKAALQIEDIEQMQIDFEKNLAENKRVQDAAKAELDRIFKEIEWSKNAYAGGAMAWPVPGFSQLSSRFGPRFGGSDYHTGTDITGGGIYGHNIVAANDGTVVKANWSYSQGVGYGIYVLIDHGVDTNGNSVSTLYAHCSNISVQVGQNVKRGQVIAQVGSTGWSTGPHLHFEVRLNGKAVNAEPYIM